MGNARRRIDIASDLRGAIAGVARAAHGFAIWDGDRTVYTNRVGWFIGSGGSNIRAIRDRFGVSLSIRSHADLGLVPTPANHTGRWITLRSGLAGYSSTGAVDLVVPDGLDLDTYIILT